MENNQQNSPAPSTPSLDAEQQVVHIARPHNPSAPVVPEEIQRLHEESRRRYKTLNLSAGEYVISAVKRHPIGIVKIWFFVALLILVTGVFTYFFTTSDVDLTGVSQALNSGIAGSIFIVLTLIYLLGGIAASYIYESNEFYLTNESVIQEIQLTLFSRHEQTVSLLNIEDASFEQRGIVAGILNYGNIRLSTEGDETTYRFQYVSNPKREIALLNNAVEAYKNGRPVDHDD